MCAGNFVVGDDLVVPIDDVDAAVGAVGHGDGAEEGIVAGEEVGGLFEIPIRAVAMHGDGLDLGDDGIGDGHHMGGWSRVALSQCNKGALFRRNRATFQRAAFDERESAQTGAAHAELGGGRELGLVALAQACHAAGVVGVFVEGHDGVAVVVGLLDEGLAFAGHDEAPDVVRAGAGDFEFAAVGAHARHGAFRPVNHFVGAGAFDLAVVEEALRHPDPAAGGTRELVRKEMRVLHAEAGEDDLALVGLAIAIGVFEQEQVVTVQRVAGIARAPREDAERDGEAVGENGRIRESTRGKRRIHRLPRIDEHLVLAFTGIHRLRGGGVFIGIHRILQRGLRPHPPSLIKVNADKLANAVALLDDEFDLVAVRDVKLLQLLLRGQRSALDVVVAGVAFLSGNVLKIGGGLSLAFGLPLWSDEFARGLDATQRFPSWCARCRRQFFDRHVFDLHEASATTVHLRADETIQRDVFVRLGEVDAEDAIDPGLDARAFGADAVFVPAGDIDDLVERGLLLGRGCPDDLVAPSLVVDFAEPARAAIHLIAAHVRTAGHAHAADLNAAVEHAGLRIAADFDFELQLEVLVVLLRADEVVLFDLLRGGAAGDHAVLHTPDFRIVVPAVEGLAIENGNGLRVQGGGGEEKSKDGLHGWINGWLDAG